MPQDPSKPTRVMQVSELQNAQVQITDQGRLRVEFRIDDLIKKLRPGGGVGPVANCGGCHGCMGCSM